MIQRAGIDQVRSGKRNHDRIDPVALILKLPKNLEKYLNA
jgi:hypothetical protein